MSKTLKIARNFTLPIESVTQTFGVLAKRGAGKSNAAVVMAEEMFAAQIPWIAIDPKGDWYGVRSSADGRKPGLPVVVFGGLHADVPLHADGGELLADLLIDERLTCVVDVSEFTKAEQRRFLVAFADRYFRRQKRKPEPVHLFLEEAHEYLPQRVMKDEAVLVGLWSRIVKQGRSFGLGVTVISQRSASLNKDVLTQIETLIVMRTTSPQDRKAISDWVYEHDIDKTMLPSLPSLGNGEAWVWSPHFLQTFERIKFRQRTTFDSGATPKLGQVRKPTTLADIDLRAIESKWAESIERAKEADPRELRKRIKELERELENRPTEEKVVEKVFEVVPQWLPERIRKLYSLTQDTLGALRSVEQETDDIEQELKRMGEVARVTTNTGVRTEPARPARTSPRVASGPSDSSLNSMEHKLLQVLLQHGAMGQDKLLLLSGYRVGGAYYTAMKGLRERGYVNKGAPIDATPKALSAAGDVAPLPSGEELFEFWCKQFGGMEENLLGVLRANDGLSQEELLELSGYKVGGAYYTAMKKLRTAGLVNKGAPIRLSDTFRDLIG